MLPIDPTDSSDPGGPITWPPQLPLPASWAATVWIFVSDRSRSPRRKCVGRVLRAGSPVPQGFSGPFLDILRVPACRPQDGSTSSTDIGPSSTGTARPVDLAGRLGAATVPHQQRGPRRSAVPRPRAGPVGSAAEPASLATRRGNGRRALIGMSYKGPSAGERPGQARGPLHRPVLVTLPIDPADSSDPGGPVTWPPRRLSQQAGRPPCGSSSPADPALPGGSA